MLHSKKKLFILQQLIPAIQRFNDSLNYTIIISLMVLSRVLDLISSMTVSSVSERKPAYSKTNSTSTCYQIDQQVKLMDLQAEVDLLLLKLQQLKQEKDVCTHEQSC